jgi:hypothetical protein
MTRNRQGKSDVTIINDDTFSLLIERALLTVDLSALKVLWEDHRSEVEEGLLTIETLIRDDCGTKFLDNLVTAGCNKDVLLWLLHPFSRKPVFHLLEGTFYTEGPRNSEALFKRNPTQIKKLLKRVEAFATEIETLNLDFEFNYLLPCGGPELKQFWELPDTVRNYAKFISHTARNYGRGSDRIYNIRKAQLTSYVKNETSRFHDKEIAALIGAMLGEPYDAINHTVWRRKHYDSLARLWDGPGKNGRIRHARST